jgi:predicted dehydrogenase
MEAVRFGVVGVGGMGAAHVNEILKLQEAVLVAGADVSKDARDKFIAEKSVPCYDSYKELIARDDIQAICIVIPHPLHRQVAVDALRAGKHVLCEKPIASHPKDADEMIAAAKETGRKLGIVFQNRFNPLFQEAARLIHTGALGDVLRANLIARHLRTQQYYNRAGWRGTWAGEGGGVLLNQAPHALDLFVWLAGMPVRVWGLTGTRLHEMQTEDEASAVLEYPNGSQGTIQANTFEGPDSVEMQIHCTKGRLHYDKGGMRIVGPKMPVDDFIAGAPGNMDSQKYETQTISLPDTAPHQETIRDFAMAVAENRPPAVPAEDGLKSLELANGIILSSERGKCVTFPLDREDYYDLLQEKVKLHAKK